MLDGNIAEWGSLSADAASADVQPKSRYPLYNIIGQPLVASSVRNAENPHDANVRVAVAFSAKGVSVAADFGDRRLDVLGIGFAKIDFNRDSEEILESSNGAFPERLRYLRINKGSVELVTDEGTKPLAEARVAVAKDGRSLEASLPNGVLPPLDEAPLEHMVMAVSLGSELPTNYFAPPYRWVKLGAPVHYQPQAELRERVMALVAGEGPAGGSTIRYWAEDPMLITSSPADSVLGELQTPDVLYEKKATLGDVSICLPNLECPRECLEARGVGHALRAEAHPAG